ncbi:MAG: BamA/TamA family outer membrane protein [Fibrobacterales bacterium]
MHYSLSLILCLCPLLFGGTITITPRTPALDSIKNSYTTPYSPARDTLLAHEYITHLSNTGYPFATVQSYHKNDTSFFAIQLNALYFWGALINRDSSRSSDSLINRFADVPVGTPYSEKELTEITQAIERSPFFTLQPQQPSEEIAQHSNRNILYPTPAVRDAPVNRLELLFGYSNNNSPIAGSIYGDFFNILGTLRSLQLYYAATGGATDISVEYTEPWLFDTPLALTLSGLLREEDALHQRAQFSIGVSLPLSRKNTIGLSFGAQTITDSLTTTNRYLTSLSLTHDSRDRYQLPRSGLYWSTHSTFSKGPHQDSLSGDQFTLATTVKVYYALTQKIVIQSSLYSGVLLSAAPILPIESYQLGGHPGSRGYRNRAFYAQSYLGTPLEIQLQLSRSNALYLFTDPLLYNTIDSKKWHTAIGYGFGLSQTTKVATLGLAFGSHPRLPLGETFVHLNLSRYF